MNVAAASYASTDATKRSLAPDLARGFMLLAIAIAHAPAFIADFDRGPAALNAAAEFCKHLLADNQARTLFVLLFGYGLGQLAERHLSRGGDWTDVRRLLRRRGWWLLVIGFLHAALLVTLDIIAAYGATLLLFAALVRTRDAVLMWTAALTLVPATLMVAWQGMVALTLAADGTPMTLAEFMADDYLTHVVTNAAPWPLDTLVSVVAVVPGMLFGIWAARRRYLDEPERHTALLRRVAVIGIAASLTGRLPATLLHTGLWTTDSTPLAWAAMTAHTLAGNAGGIAIAAAIGLAAIPLARRPGPVTTALAALGQRSLTFYLFQSVVFVALFYPFTLDLSADMGIAATYGIAIATWLLSVALADWMRRTGNRGPTESILRRLTYGRSPSR
ncbi:DUF418 domain-containing protein [Allonocardiopsis opalescens]|uniref:Putative membrane protein YeiB n=1 Tax=Allonocardiopsis opalescens TaxID=1144618 RepID=A0A2T0PT99_9ACTN|nr:DUF418 domain-containing protein [Allonocardiopsis opalescens]PRX92131.1 putative membrane protein YeiB [Allonocardiopsis opalescens]